MVEVEMTKDIRNYEPKLFGLVTVRQLILLAIGCAYAIPLAFFLPIEDVSIRVTVATIALIPVILLGWVNVYGMRLEQFLFQAIQSLILTPTNRKYKTQNTVDFLKEKNEEVDTKKVKIIRSSEYPARK